MPVAVITGAERGIGKEAARQLLERGFAVVIGSFDNSLAVEAQAELSAIGDVRWVHMDVTDDDSINSAFSRIEEDVPVVDVLVNNAGIVDLGSALDITRQQLHEIFNVNAFGAAMVTRAAIPRLQGSAHPRIVNVSSGGGSLGRSALFAKTGATAAPILAYAASKAALNMITVQTSLALGSAPDLRHIKVNSVGPGTTATHVSGFQGQDVADGARIIVQLATADDESPTGGFFDIDCAVEW